MFLFNTQKIAATSIVLTHRKMLLQVFLFCLAMCTKKKTIRFCQFCSISRLIDCRSQNCARFSRLFSFFFLICRQFCNRLCSPPPFKFTVFRSATTFNGPSASIVWSPCARDCNFHNNGQARRSSQLAWLTAPIKKIKKRLAVNPMAGGAAIWPWWHYLRVINMASRLASGGINLAGRRSSFRHQRSFLSPPPPTLSYARQKKTPQKQQSTFLRFPARRMAASSKDSHERLCRDVLYKTCRGAVCLLLFTMLLRGDYSFFFK